MRSRAAIVACLAVLVLGAAVLAVTTLIRDDATDGLRVRHERARRVRDFNSAAGVPLEATPPELAKRLAERGFLDGTRVFIRIFKLDFELEVWLEKAGRFERFATYPICRWSGDLGPKLREGDKQAPEGFYTVAANQLNPNSRWHRSFNVGFPNAFDRAWGRTGSFLMVHGGCSSIGCYAMTDPQIDEIWRLVTSALASGQPRIHVHIFPFKLTEQALARRRSHPAHAFWESLEPGYRAFESSGLVPRVSVCRGRYAIEAGRGGALAGAEALAERCPDVPFDPAASAGGLPVPTGTTAPTKTTRVQ